MTKKKVSELPVGSVLSGADQAPVLQDGVLKRFTMAAVRLLVGNDTLGVQLVGRGGTGQTTAPAAINALLPTQAGHGGDVLQTDGTAASWAAPAGGGGLTDVTSAGGTLTVTTLGTVRNVELNPAHTNTFTIQQNFNATVGGVAYSNRVLDSVIGAAQVITSAGNNTEIRFANGGTAIYVYQNAGGIQMTLGDGSNAILVNTGLVDLRDRTQISGLFSAFGVVAVAQQASGGALVDATGGAVGGTLNAVAGTGDDAHINDNFASVSAKVETLRAGLAALGWFS